MICEGSKVAYVGDGGGRDEGLSVEDQGQVLALAGPNSCHVLWHTGARTGAITLAAFHDLVEQAQPAPDALDDSLSYGPLMSISVKATYERKGGVGLLNALNKAGHLVGFEQIAEDALSMVATRLRQDISFRSVLAELDTDDGEDFLQLTAAVLLRDAFGGHDG